MEESVAFSSCGVVTQEIKEKARLAAAMLEEKGYAVIEDVLSASECAQLRDEFHGLRNKFANNSKWPVSERGMIEMDAVAHSSVAWKARIKTLPFWAALWGTGDLLCSFDRVNAASSNRSSGPWLHTDQSGQVDGLACVQGFLDVNGTCEEDGGLRVAVGSHKAHFDLLNRWGKVKKNHWYLLRPEERDYVLQFYPPKKVLCKPGSLILWDSRTFHDNISPAGKMDRFVVYICMMPKAIAELGDFEGLKKARKNAFLKRMATPHWPVLPGLFGRADQSEANVDMGQPKLSGTVRALVLGEEGPALQYDGEACLIVDAPRKLFPDKKK